MSKLAVAYDNALAKSWHGEFWYTDVNLDAIRLNLARMYRVLWASEGKRGNPDPTVAKRIVSMLKLFAILRESYYPREGTLLIPYLLPTSVRCTTSDANLCKRVRYLFNTTLRRKADLIFKDQHINVVRRIESFSEELIAKGAAELINLEWTSEYRPLPNPIMTYMEQTMRRLMYLGQLFIGDILMNREFETLNDWADAIQMMPASWEAISNEKGSVKRAKLLNDCSSTFFNLLKGESMI
jgi:hypothetical protein